MTITKKRLEKEQKIFDLYKKIVFSKQFLFIWVLLLILMSIRIPSIYYYDTQAYLLFYPIVQILFIIWSVLIMYYFIMRFSMDQIIKAYTIQEKIQEKIQEQDHV